MSGAFIASRRSAAHWSSGSSRMARLCMHGSKKGLGNLDVGALCLFRCWSFRLVGVSHVHLEAILFARVCWQYVFNPKCLLALVDQQQVCPTPQVVGLGLQNCSAGSDDDEMQAL